ncbi:hypothetical protein BGZ50_007809 [Haplosporangium sp. Z 11]|nr:hypothetical protein BGZ50_007809 [Haplosporangium sp. Z 11]
MDQGRSATAPPQSILPVQSSIIEQLSSQGKALSQNIRGRHTKFGSDIAAIIESYGTSIEQDANLIFQEYARTKAALDSSSRDLTSLRTMYEALVSELSRIRQAYATSQQEVQRLKSAYSLLFSQRSVSLPPQQLQNKEQSQQQPKEKSFHESQEQYQEQYQQPGQNTDEERHRAEFQIMAAELLRAMDDVEKLKAEKERLENNWIRAEQARRELVDTVNNKTVVNSQLGAIVETKQLEINVLRQRIDKLTTDLKMSHEFITEYYEVLVNEVNRRRQHKGLDTMQAVQTLEPGTDAQGQRTHELISTTGLSSVSSQPTGVLVSTPEQTVPASASPIAASTLPATASAPSVAAVPPATASAPSVAAPFPTLSHGSALMPKSAASLRPLAPAAPSQPGSAGGPKMGSFSKAVFVPPTLNKPYKGQTNESGPWPPLGNFQTGLYPKDSLTAQRHQSANGPRRPRNALQPKESRAQQQTPPLPPPPPQQQQTQPLQQQQAQPQQQEEQQQVQQSHHAPQTQIETSGGLNMQRTPAAVDRTVDEGTPLTINNSVAPEEPSPTGIASKAGRKSSTMTGQEPSIASDVSAAPEKLSPPENIFSTGKEPSLTEGEESSSAVNTSSMTPTNVMELSKRTLHAISKIPGLQEQIPLFISQPSEVRRTPFKRRIIVEEEEEEEGECDIYNAVYDNEQRGEPEPKKQQQDRWLLAAVEVPSLHDARSKIGVTEGETLRKIPSQSLNTQQSTAPEVLTSAPASSSSAMVVSSTTTKSSMSPASNDKATTPTVVTPAKNSVTEARRHMSKGQNNPAQDLDVNINTREDSAADSSLAVKAPLAALVPSVAAPAVSKENKVPAAASNGVTTARVAAGTTVTSSTKASKSSKPRKSSKPTRPSTMESLWPARFPNFSNVLMNGLFGPANGVDNATPIIATEAPSTKSSVLTLEAVVDPEETP